MTETRRDSVHLDMRLSREEQDDVDRMSKIVRARARCSAASKGESKNGQREMRKHASSWLWSALTRYWLALVLGIFIVVDKSGFIDWAELQRSYPRLQRRTSSLICNAFAPIPSTHSSEWL